jgi:prefoldin subunit 5
MFGTVTGTQSGGGLLGSGFLGSKTTRNITDSGLLIEGTFAQLASDTNKAVIDFFEQVTVSKKTWYGKTKTWIETNRSEIDDATSEFFKDIFGNATELFIEVGSKSGIGPEVVNQILGSLNVGEQFASLRGLKGEEFQQELSAIIGTLLDDAALAIFGSFEQYANFGEGMLETVMRVVDTNTKVNQALKNLGVGFEAQLQSAGVLVERSVTKQVTSMFGIVNKTITETVLETSFDPKDIQMESYRITESLVEASGGLEEFLSKTQFFAENFLTEAERLAPTQKAVTDELTRLGYSSVDTREEFKQLVQAQDLTTEAGRNNFTALMNVAEGFDTVATAAEQAAEELNSATQSLFSQILQLTGSSAEILAAQRAQTLAETPAELQGLQSYIFALEDVKTAEAALTKAREAEVSKLKQQKSTTEATINSLKNYIDSLKKFKDSLLLGAASPLTPAQKYAEAQRQFDAILATATGTAVTPAEIAAKESALSQLEGASTAFLDASRIYNASSSQYTEDFNLVQRALTASGSSLAQQLSTEEKSLAALNSQIDYLQDQIDATNSVNSSVLSVADAVDRLAAAQGVASTIASNLGPGGTTAMYSALGGKILGNQLFGLNGLQGVVAGEGGSTEGTLNFMRLVEAGQQTAAELRRIYVEDWGLDSKMMAYIIGSTQQEVLDWFKMMDPSLPAFARGTNYVPEDMVAQIHQGERIVPAADNAELMASIGNRNRTNEVLVAEIRKLNQKIDSLEKTVADGAVINAQATERNTVEISRTVKNTGSTASHSEAIRRRTQIV